VSNQTIQLYIDTFLEEFNTYPEEEFSIRSSRSFRAANKKFPELSAARQAYALAVEPSTVRAAKGVSTDQESQGQRLEQAISNLWQTSPVKEAFEKRERLLDIQRIYSKLERCRQSISEIETDLRKLL
jgi:hypothetical protein